VRFVTFGAALAIVIASAHHAAAKPAECAVVIGGGKSGIEQDVLNTTKESP
jgi:hypothetical protein